MEVLVSTVLKVKSEDEEEFDNDKEEHFDAVAPAIVAPAAL